MGGFTPAVAIRRRCRPTASLIHSLDFSKPSANAASSTLGVPSWYSDQLASVPLASTIMMATSPSSRTRPATTISNVESAPSA